MKDKGGGLLLRTKSTLTTGTVIIYLQALQVLAVNT